MEYLVVVPHGWCRDKDLKTAIRNAMRYGSFKGNNPPCIVVKTDDTGSYVDDFGRIMVNQDAHYEKIHEGTVRQARAGQFITEA